MNKLFSIRYIKQIIWFEPSKFEQKKIKKGSTLKSLKYYLVVYKVSFSTIYCNKL